MAVQSPDPVAEFHGQRYGERKMREGMGRVCGFTKPFEPNSSLLDWYTCQKGWKNSLTRYHQNPVGLTRYHPNPVGLTRYHPNPVGQ